MDRVKRRTADQVAISILALALAAFGFSVAHDFPGGNGFVFWCAAGDRSGFIFGTNDRRLGHF